MTELRRILARDAIGRALPLVYLRRGKRVETEVRPVPDTPRRKVR